MDPKWRESTWTTNIDVNVNANAKSNKRLISSGGALNDGGGFFQV